MFKFTQNLAKFSQINRDESQISVKTSKPEILNNISDSLKYSSPEPSNINFLRSTPTKNIFFEFVSNFLAKPKLLRIKTKKTSTEVPSVLRSPIELPQLKVGSTPSPNKFLFVKVKNIHSQRLAFPSLKPSASFSNFLVKEKIRLESNNLERASLIREAVSSEIKPLKPTDRQEQRDPSKKLLKKTKKKGKSKSKKLKKKLRKVFKQE